MTSIAIVAPGLALEGSVARVAIHHAIELQKKNQITLISESFPAWLKPHPNRQNLAVHPHSFTALRRFGHAPREFAFAWSSRMALLKICRESPPDFVLFHGHVPAHVAGIALRRRFSVPYGLVAHGDIFDRPKGTYDPALTRLYKYSTPLAYRYATLCVAVSPYMAECAARGGASKHAIELIPNGVDREELGLSEDPAPKPVRYEGDLRLLYVGRLSVEKGPDTLLTACRQLALKNIEFHLSVVGSGPLEGELRTQVIDCGLARHVEFLGQRTRLMLGRVYREADLLIVPSRSDALPGVVLEALVCGTPVIGSSVGGIPSMVSEANGQLIRPDCPEDLSTAIARFANDRDEIARLSAGAMASVRCRFSWDRIGEQLNSAICSRLLTTIALQSPVDQKMNRQPTVSAGRWHAAQQWELQFWNRQNIPSPLWKRIGRPALVLLGLREPIETVDLDDRNNWWRLHFDDYKHVPLELKNACELGCGPYTNMRLFCQGRRIEFVHCSDPLGPNYVQYPKAWLGRQARAGRVSVDFHPAEDCPFRSGYFDVCILINVLDHVRSPLQCVREAMRIVKVGGYLIFGQDLTDQTGALPGNPGHPFVFHHEALEPVLAEQFDVVLRKLISADEVGEPEMHYGALAYIGKKRGMAMSGQVGD